MMQEKKQTLVRKIVPALVAIILLSLTAVSGTLAYIATNSNTVINSFEPAQMSCEVSEDFSDGVTKKSVCVKNTSDTAAYIRVKILPYWYDNTNETIVAKKAWEPQFTLGTGWVLGEDGYYYHLTPVPAGSSTAVLIPSVTLKQDEVTLARQVLEIIASCIQAEPADAVVDAWSGTNGSVNGVEEKSLVVKVTHPKLEEEN